ncbi:MAG: BatA and WFA domain-containing protein, partial [Myxococcales bacterium]|nr:BatA and WFA domain-containing protein [Myxococcales bacterium]
MGFATPIALLALGAIAIPALIHLMRRRDLPKVELPTLAFLTRAKAESRRKLHLIDLLLLLVRMAMIALFALALAKPYRTVVHSYGSGDPIALTVVLDDSMSMMRKDGSDTLLQQAVDRAKELTAHLPEGSEVALVLAGSPARTLGTALRDDATVASTLDAMATTSARGTDMPQAMDLAQAHAMASKLSSKAIVVLSDMAAHASWDRVAWPPPSIPVDLLRIGGDPAPNRFIGTVEVAPDPTLKDSLSVWVDILEAGSAEGPTAPAEVRILVGDEIQAREAVKTTDPNGRVRLWVPTPEGEGIDGKVVLVVDDSIETDNQAGLLLRGDRKLNVLWIHGHLRRYTRAGESRFFEHALEALGRRVRVTQQDPDFFYTQHGKSSDLLWMTHLARPSPGLAKAAREHVEAGGGLVLVPGRDSDFRSWRTTFGDLLPSVPGEIVTEAEPLDLVVPPGSPLEITGLEGAKVTRRLLLERTLTGGEVWL